MYWMRIVVLFIILSFSLTSCVSILNRDYVTFRINVSKDADVKYNKKYPGVEYDAHTAPSQAAKGERKEVFLTAKRSKNDTLALSVTENGKERTIRINPVHSNVYYWNIYPFCAVGFLIDAFNENRFTYPRLVYVDSNTRKGYITHVPFNDRKWALTLTPPLTNIFITKFNYVDPSANPFGLAVGFNYHYSENSYVAAEFGCCFGRFLPRNIKRKDSIRDFKYNYLLEKKTDVFVNVTNNHVLGRFDVGYGINVGTHSAYRFYQRYKMADTVMVDAHYISVGAAFSGHYRLNSNIYCGISYMPQFVAIDKTASFSYEHAFNFGVSFRLGFGEQLNRKY